MKLESVRYRTQIVIVAAAPQPAPFSTSLAPTPSLHYPCIPQAPVLVFTIVISVAMVWFSCIARSKAVAMVVRLLRTLKSHLEPAGRTRKQTLLSLSLCESFAASSLGTGRGLGGRRRGSGCIARSGRTSPRVVKKPMHMPVSGVGCTLVRLYTDQCCIHVLGL